MCLSQIAPPETLCDQAFAFPTRSVLYVQMVSLRPWDGVGEIDLEVGFVLQAWERVSGIGFHFWM